MPKIFFSYARADIDLARELEQSLIANGVEVWRDQRSIYGGQQWPKVIGEAVADCDALLLFWSEQAANSHFVEFEWTTALALRQAIIPCLLDETALPPALAAINGIACRRAEDALSSILAALPEHPQRKSARQAQVIKQLRRVKTEDIDVALEQARKISLSSAPNNTRWWLLPFASILILFAGGGLFAIYQLSSLDALSPKPTPTPIVEATTYLRGRVEDERGNPLTGAIVRVDEITGRTEPMWGTTDSNGGFHVEKIPGRTGDRVRVYVGKEGYIGMLGEAQHNEYVALPGPLPTVKLKRKK